MKDLISIIVPIYNVEKYLEQCIESIINQTYKNLQIILVDDGSPDSCGKICDMYAEKDLRIEVIHKKNGGLSDARNAGLDIVKGEYIAFIDSDDYIAENYVEKLYFCLKNNNSDIALCNLEYVDDENNLIDTKFERRLDDNCVWSQKEFWKQYYSYIGIYFSVAWNKLYKASIFETLRYDFGKYNEDEFIIDKIIFLCNRIAFINENYK